MNALRALLYIAAVACLVIAIPAKVIRGELTLAGAACAVLAFSLPVITAL